MSTQLPPSFYEECRRGKAQAAYLRRQSRKGLRSTTVNTWLGGYRYLLPDDRTPETTYQQQTNIAKFRRVYGDRQMRSITAVQAQAWALKNPASVGQLRRAWGHAARMMVVEVDVWAGVVKPRRRRDKPRAPKAEELTSILQNCVQKTMTTGTVVGIGWWHSFFDLVVVAAYTGARRAGLIDMRAADVDLEGRRLALREKGGKERTVVLAGAALHAMDRQMTRRDVAGWSQIPSARGESPHVWLTQTGRAFSPKTISEYWDRVRGDFPFGIHSLRHFAATWLAERGVDELDIAVQLGHVDQQGRPYRELVDRIYNHPDPEAALRRVQAAIEGGA